MKKLLEEIIWRYYRKVLSLQYQNDVNDKNDSHET